MTVFYQIYIFQVLDKFEVFTNLSMFLRFPVRLGVARGGFTKIYESRIKEGRINFDERQTKVVSLFQELGDRLISYKPPIFDGLKSVGKSGWFNWLSAEETKINDFLESPLCEGLYLYGGTGTGKTMLMDLFFENLEISRKKRVHFHAWMLETHQRLFELQKSRKHSENDLVDLVADEMLKDAFFICFDEFQVTFISDAVIMRRLFTKLFEKGAVIVATSNRPPRDLYLNGLNRELFTPFIPLLEKFCVVHNIDSAVDYRMLASSESDERSVYLSPLDERNRRTFESKFFRLAQNSTNSQIPLEVQGRTLRVTRTAKNTAIAWFSFKELCDKPLGAADYLTIAHRFHTIFVEAVPKLTLQERDQMRRFITLVDALYDNKVRLVVSAEAPPMQLFVLTEAEKKVSGVMDEVFAWDRLVSRLSEMQSSDYLVAHAQRISANEMLGQFHLGQLTETDIADLWSRYDKDGNGHIDAHEVKALLADLFEHTAGHRHVSDEIAQLALNEMDRDKNGVVDAKEFAYYVTKNGLAIHKLA